MKQVQIRNILEGSEKYNEVLCKGLMDDTGEYLYLFDCFTKREMFTLTVDSLHTKSKVIEETTCLSNMELGFLVKFIMCVTTLKHFNRKKDNFEYEGKRLANNEDKLSLLDLVDCYKEMDEIKEEYIKALDRIEDLTNQLDELQNNFLAYLSNPTEEDSAFDLLGLILRGTGAYLEDDQIKLAFKGNASLVDLAGLLSYNSELYYVCKLFGLDVDIKGSIGEVAFTLVFNYKLKEPLTTPLANELIKELAELTNFLKDLNKDYKVNVNLEIDGVN